MDITEKSIVEFQEMMADGTLTAVALVHLYIDRINQIDRSGPELRSIIELNPQAEAIAAELDAERAEKGARGPLHGIPILLKDNIDTDDQMLTTAGSLALVDSRPQQDATIVQKLRDAGAIIFGKANLSEWANFRSTKSTSGWSGRGGQTKNPYMLPYNSCGSSSGSGVAVSANLTAVAIGTETDGSIVCPSAVNGIVGIKPTVGLLSRAGIVPIAHSQDTAGPMARTVADATAVLGAMVGIDERDPATAGSRDKFYTDYTQFLDSDGLRGARIGVARDRYMGYDAQLDAIIEEAISAISRAGATVIDPADIPTAKQIEEDGSELDVLLYEIKSDMGAYLASRVPVESGTAVPRTLADLIAFNIAHADQELAHFGQELFEMAQAKGSLSDHAYLEALLTSRRLSRQEGIDAVMAHYELDALIAPTTGPAWVSDYDVKDDYRGSCSTPPARAGYPLITVPAGFVGELPVALGFMGRAYSEPTLIRLAYAFEQLLQARRPPKFLA